MNNEINNATVMRGKSMKLKVQIYNTIARKSYFNVKVVDFETDSQHQ